MFWLFSVLQIDTKNPLSQTVSALRESDCNGNGDSNRRSNRNYDTDNRLIRNSNNICKCRNSGTGKMHHLLHNNHRYYYR